MNGDLQTRPAWSPDSRFLVITEGVNHGTDYPLCLVDVTTSNVTKLNAQGAGAAVSPDGNWVAFSGDFKGIEDLCNGVPGTGSILVQQIGAPNSARRITPEGQGAVLPSWSPDGSRILYVTGWPTGRTHIYVVQADGSSLEEIYNCSEIVMASWSADGRSVYVQREGGLLQVAADGSGSVTDLGGNARTARSRLTKPRR